MSAVKHTPGVPLPFVVDEDFLLPDDWYIDMPITSAGRLVAAAITTPGKRVADARALAAYLAHAANAYPDLVVTVRALLHLAEELDSILFSERGTGPYPGEPDEVKAARELLCKINEAA